MLIDQFHHFRSRFLYIRKQEEEILDSPHSLTITEPGVFHVTRLADQNCGAISNVNNNYGDLSSITVHGNPRASFSGGKFIGDDLRLHLSVGAVPWYVMEHRNI